MRTGLPLLPQLLRAFHVQARGLALDKSHDIAGTQPCERHAARAESIDKESTDSRHVMGDGRIRQHALVA